MAGLTDEQFNVIARLANQGLAGRELREAVYEELGLVLGRNQIGGILYRLRASQKVTVRPDRVRVVARRSRHDLPMNVSRAGASGMPMLAKAGTRFAPPSVTHAREAAPSPLKIAPVVERGPAPLFDLHADSCRWPLWADGAVPFSEKLFCNEVRQGGDGPYCAAHTRASHNRHDHPVSIRNAAYVKKTYFD